jgi:hypothetical protein
MKGKLVGQRGEEHFCVAPSDVVPLEEEAAAEMASILESLTKGLHDG